MEREISDEVKKNILDLQYNKYLQYYNTSIIILFTYYVGVGIAFLTKQLNLGDSRQFLSFGLVSISITTVIILLMLNFRSHQQKILEEIKKLGI